MDGPTVVDESGALEATALGHATGGVPTSMRGSVRTTVLPRIEWTGSAPVLVSTERPRFAARGGLGEGGVGEVVAALDQDIGREVAIKRLRPGTLDPATLARFVDEIRTVGALEHPNIVPIHDVGVDEDGALYFVMRKVQGQTLEAIVDRLSAGDPVAHRQWTFERRAHVFRQLLDAVAFAHERGFVHRDIKPSNVMIGPFGEVFLMDWGIARPLDGAERPLAPSEPGRPPSRVTTTHVGAIVGTPVFMSPEQARGDRVDARSDVYSLCVLLHELLCLRHYLTDHMGESPDVDAVLAAIQHAKPTAPTFVANAHQTPPPMDLSWFTLKGLEKDPARRYQTVREMIERLDARDDGVIPIQCHVTFLKRVSREIFRAIDRHPYAFSVGLVVAVVGFLVLLVLRLLHL